MKKHIDRIAHFSKTLFLKYFFPLRAKDKMVYKAQRRLFLSCLSFAFVLFLFYIMGEMISTRRDLSRLKGSEASIEFLMTKKRSRLLEKKRKLPEKKKEIKPPPFKPLAPAAPPPNLNMGVGAMPNLIGDLNIEGGIGVSDIQPIIRINPQYPVEAQMKGIEGWVLLRFDVSESGSVSNIKVLNSKPPRIFDRAAVMAVVKWKYKPQMKNGKPAKVEGVKTYLDFVMPKK